MWVDWLKWLFRFLCVGGMYGGRCRAVLVIIGVPGDKVATRNWERFCVCVSIFFRRG